MSDTTKHSPLPWTFEFDDHGGYDCMSAAYLIEDADGATVVDVDVRHFSDIDSTYEDDHKPHPVAEATASLIVRAVNSHQALIDALHMTKHIVAQEGTDEQAEQVFRALELAGEKP